MKDGSGLIDRFLTDSSYIKFTFTDKSIAQQRNPINDLNAVNFNYKLIDNYIETSPTSGYIIEKINKDSLILLEKIKNYQDDQLKRFFLISESKLFDSIKRSKIKNRNQIANRYYTPIQEKSLAYLLNKAFKYHHSNFKIKGSININIQNESIETSIIYSSIDDTKILKRIKKTINKSYKYWNLEKFKSLNSISIPFVLKDENKERFRGISIKYFTDSFYQLDNFYGGDVGINMLAGELYSKGVEAYENENYSLAIELFTESYQLDPKNIDALYNRAAVFYKLGHKELACNDWKTLAKLEQMEAIKLIEEHCQTTNNNGSSPISGSFR